jgi:hypothetical protein
MVFVSAGFAAGMGVREKWGRWGIWFVNIVSTVDFERRDVPVDGQVPLFSNVARISGSR